MKPKIKSIELENFKGVKHAKYYFAGNNVTVSGANATGKTTIFDAICWTLFNKDSLGNEKFSIRPLDENGQPIHNLEIKVTVVFDVKGKDMEFCKTQKEKWVKRRGSETTELQGNENLYEIDGYPKTEKDYKLAISNLVSEDYISKLSGEEVFKMLTSPTYFTSLHWTKERSVLMRFVSEINDYDLASEQEKFFSLMKEFEVDAMGKIPSIEDVSSKFRKYLTEWKKKQAEIPVRIDEAEKSRVVIDVAELELGKKAVQELLKSNQSKKEDISKQYEEYQKLSDGVLELQFELNDLQRKANEENNRKRREIEDRINDNKEDLKAKEEKILKTKSKIKATKQKIEELSNKLENLRSEYKTTQNLEFDENSLICSYCGQEYPIDKKDKLRADFESKKETELRRITFDGNEAKEYFKMEKAILSKLEDSISPLKDNIKKINEEIKFLEHALPESSFQIDISDREDVKAIKQQIAEKEQAMLKFNSADSIRKQLAEEERELNEQLMDFERRIALSAKNVEIDDRIAELQKEQREVGQKVADQEKMLYLLEEFIRYKMDKVSENINSMFDGVSFKMFDMQINGGMKETCECTVDGVPYGSLNNGHRIIAGLQIIKALQKLYDVQMPVFVDNAESINDFNLPQMDCQLVLLKVSDDKELVVV